MRIEVYQSLILACIIVGCLVTLLKMLTVDFLLRGIHQARTLFHPIMFYQQHVSSSWQLYTLIGRDVFLKNKCSQTSHKRSVVKVPKNVSVIYCKGNLHSLFPSHKNVTKPVLHLSRAIPKLFHTCLGYVIRIGQLCNAYLN